MEVSNIIIQSLGAASSNDVEKTDGSKTGFNGRPVELSKNDSEDRSVREAFMKGMEAPKETQEKPLLERSVTLAGSPEMKETNPADDFVVIDGNQPNILPEGDGPKIPVAKNVVDDGDDFETMDFNENDYEESRKIPEKYYRNDDPVGEKDMCAYIRSRNIEPHKSGVLASIGRFFQGVGLLLRSIFVHSEPDVETADANFVRQWEDGAYQPQNRPDAQECVTYSDHTLGLAMGLKGRVTRGPTFGELYPKGGRPCLADIKQNADLQDCWFLSTVAAVLASKGAEFIQEMIEAPDGDGNVVVHFKDRDYKVPCAELKDKDGNVSVSKSAPWVKVLEMAMQMHRMHEIFESRNGKIDMSENNAKDALDAVFGAKMDDESYNDRNVEFGTLHAGVKQSGREALAILNRWLDVEHRPVVLGHNDGIFDFVAPGHAVTLLKVDSENNAVTIMDPYGRILVKNASFLDNCTIMTSQP